MPLRLIKHAYHFKGDFEGQHVDDPAEAVDVDRLGSVICEETPVDV